MRRSAAIALLVTTSTLLEATVDTERQPTPPPPRASSVYLDDFAAAWTFIRDHYAYFEQKQIDWDRVRVHYLLKLSAVRGKAEFIALLEDLIEELYDHHAHLGINTASSPRLVPSGTDLWASYRDGRPLIADVRGGSEAERAGVRAGMEVLSIDGRPIAQVVRERLPIALRGPDSAAEDWALRASLAGRHDRPVQLEIRINGRLERVAFRPGQTNRPDRPLDFRMLDDNFGYVRLNDSLGDLRLIAAWDAALDALRYTRALVLDLRDTPGGGNTTVARGILSRLVSDFRPYQRHDLPSEERRFGVRRMWVEYVGPRGPFTYEMPIVALVGRWTGSMGEGVAIGLDSLRRATVVGTPMAGLLGATDTVTLPRSGISVRIPVERLFHIDGTPREAFVPQVGMESSAAQAGGAIETAVEMLRKTLSR